MNVRCIKSILARKYQNFVNSIKDEYVRELVRKNSIITGGSIVSLLTNEPVNDFDIYFTNFETVKAVALYYVSEFNRLHNDNSNGMTKKPYVEIEDGRIRIKIESAGIIGENTNESQYRYFEQHPVEQGEEYLENSLIDILEDADSLDGTKLPEDKQYKYRPVFLTDNAITLTDKIQIIIRFYGPPEEIHSNYDFVHCTNYWISESGKLILQKNALESILTKQLYYSGSKYPICSFIRCRKFIKRGWHINAGQMLKICLQISELDLNDIEVLEDQLTGVDTAYFIQLLDFLKAKQAKDENFHIEMPYVISLIDKIFQ